MPKRKASRNINIAGKKDEVEKPRIAANGHRLPDRLPKGEILTDIIKRKWILGKAIGVGGFGEIYLASDDIKKCPGNDADYIIKIEPHTNGPLFSEMHFYHRVGKAEQIEEWKKKKNLKFLGMPKFIGSGSHESKGVRYRFMVLERFGEDLQKLLDKNNRVFPVNTVYTLGIKILHILEYVHSYGYIHADVKASNLMSGFGNRKEKEVHLIDFGLACKYKVNGIHKEYKEDARKAHDGTIEFTSRDAHIGAHSRRGDLEILGYNMLQWLCGELPWEHNLKDPEYVYCKKKMYMNNIPRLMEHCFPDGNAPRGIQEYLTYVVNLKFDEDPDYDHCVEILKSAIKSTGMKYQGKLVYKCGKSSFPQKRCAPKDFGSPPRKIQRRVPLLRKMASESAGVPSSIPSTPCKKVRRVASATPRLQTSKKGQTSIKEYMSTIDNPTPAMLLVMQRKLEQLQQQSGMDKLKNGILKIDITRETRNRRSPTKCAFDGNCIGHDERRSQSPPSPKKCFVKIDVKFSPPSAHKKHLSKQVDSSTETSTRRRPLFKLSRKKR